MNSTQKVGFWGLRRGMQKADFGSWKGRVLGMKAGVWE